MIAFNTYYIPLGEHDVLVSDYTVVEKKYRRNGLSELLLGEILADHPWIKKIRLEKSIVGTNKDEAEAAVLKGKCKEAILLSPAYKKFAFFGFTEIKDATCDKDEGVTFTVTKPKKKK